MLTAMTHRLALTGLLITAFVGSGLLFDQGSVRANRGNSVEIAINVGEKPVKIDELNVGVATPHVRRNRAFEWPFFSFSKGGR